MVLKNYQVYLFFFYYSNGNEIKKGVSSCLLLSVLKTIEVYNNIECFIISSFYKLKTITVSCIHQKIRKQFLDVVLSLWYILSDILNNIF